MTRLPVLIASGALLLVSGGVLADNATSTAPSDNSTKTDADNQNMSQDDTTTTPTTTPTDDSSVPPPPSEDSSGATQSNIQQTSDMGGMGINQLVGVDIHNANDEKIAEIKDMLIGDNNTVDTAIVTVGGVMGVAGRDVAIDLKQIQLVRDQDTIRAKVDMTEDQLKALPEYTSDGGVWHTK